MCACISDSSEKSLKRDRLKRYGQATSDDLRLGTLLDSIPDDPDSAVLEAWEEFVWRVALARKTRERIDKERGRVQIRERRNDNWGPWADWNDEPALIDFWSGIEESAAATVPPPSAAWQQASVAGRERLIEDIPVLQPTREGEAGPRFVFDSPLPVRSRSRSPSPRSWVNSYTPAESPSAAAEVFYSALGRHAREESDEARTLRRVRRRVLHREAGRDTRRDGVVFPDAMDWDSIHSLSEEPRVSEVSLSRAVRDAERARRAESLSLREVAHRRSAGELERASQSSPLRETDGRPVARLPRRTGRE